MNNRLSIMSLLIAVVTLGIVLFNSAADTSTVPGKETAYERVMRTHTLRCGYALWPSETDMDPNTKKLTGIVPDFTEQLGKKLGLKIEWTEEVLWGQQAEALKTGRIDAICASDGPWVYSGAAYVDYVTPMLYVPIYLYGREGETRFKTLEDINNENVTLSAMDGDASMTLAVERFPKAKRIELPQAADPSLVVTNVMTQKADLVIMSPQTVEAVNKNNETKLVKIFDEPLIVVSSSLSVAKGEQELHQLLNQGMSLLHQLNISDDIIDRYDPDHKLILRVAKGWGKIKEIADHE